MTEEKKPELSEEEKKKLKWGQCDDCGEEGRRTTVWCCNERVCSACAARHMRSKSCAANI